MYVRKIVLKLTDVIVFVQVEPVWQKSGVGKELQDIALCWWSDVQCGRIYRKEQGYIVPRLQTAVVWQVCWSR